jgi:predicted Zn-dependent protease with MMP-like domain
MRAYAMVAILLVGVTAGCLSNLGNGSSAAGPYDYLRGAKYSTWLIEVDYVKGMKPDQSALNLLKARLASMATKEHIIIQVSVEPLVESKQTWTRDDVMSLHKKYLNQKTGNGQVVTHVLYLDGKYDSGPNGGTALGVAFGWDVIAIMKKSIQDACDPLNLCFYEDREIEQAVLVHEFGHAMGLVNNPLPMVRNHEDPDHPHHSSNRNSVMYYAVETALGISGLTSLPNDFDADDRRDVCEAGGRPACG